MQSCRRPRFCTNLGLLALALGFTTAGCHQDDSLGSRTSAESLAGEARLRVVDTGAHGHQHGEGPYRQEHRLPWGTCVTVTPPPPPWAYATDGTLKPPSAVVRPKDGSRQILYLNIDGGRMRPGYDDPENNQSGIFWNEVDYPAFDDEPFRMNHLDTREKVVHALVAWVTYFYARTNVLVTTKRPSTGTPYTMIMVGGSPQLIGESSGVLGIATFDCYKDPGNVGLVFAESHGSNLQMLVLTIVHEAGHTFGLAHINQQDAIMYPSSSGGSAYWGQGQTTDSRACDGSTYQESLPVLQEMLGPRGDVVPPWVEIKSPGDRAVVPPTLDALVHGTDNIVLYQVELFLNGTSVGTQSLPTFGFLLRDLPDGFHELLAVGEDAHGNMGASSPVTVEVRELCDAVAECLDGLGAVGDLCQSGKDCMTEVCAQTTEGMAVCSKPCGAEDPCPLGTQCVEEAYGDDPQIAPLAWCAAGSPPVVVLQARGDTAQALLSGCSATAGSGPDSLTSLLFAFLGLLLSAIARSRGNR